MFRLRFFVPLPVEQPDFLGAGQSGSELVSLCGVIGAHIFLPDKLPLFLPTAGQSLAIDGQSQVGVDSGSNRNTHIYLHEWFSELLNFGFPGLNGARLSSSLRMSSFTQVTQLHYFYCDLQVPVLFQFWPFSGVVER